MASSREESGLGTGTVGSPQPATATTGGDARRACRLVDRDGSKLIDFDPATGAELLRSADFFWLDLYQPHERDYETLRTVFGFHPLAIEDSEHFGQRPKLDDYDDFVFL